VGQGDNHYTTLSVRKKRGRTDCNTEKKESRKRQGGLCPSTAMHPYRLDIPRKKMGKSDDWTGSHIKKKARSLIRTSSSSKTKRVRWGIGGGTLLAQGMLKGGNLYVSLPTLNSAKGRSDRASREQGISTKIKGGGKEEEPPRDLDNMTKARSMSV